MARNFNGDLNNHLSVDVAPVTAAPLTLACWFRHDNVTDQDTVMFLGDKDVVGDFFSLGLRGATSGDPVEARARRNTSARAETTTGFSADTWHHGCAVFTSTTSRAAFIDGGSKGTDTTSKIPADADRVRIGQLGDSTPTERMTGRIAEAAIWNVALSDDEVVSLAGGTSPLMVRSGSLVGYWPIYGVDAPEPDLSGQGNNLTVSVTTQVDHSPTALMLSPPTGWQGAFTVAAAGISIPVVYHHRQRNF